MALARIGFFSESLGMCTSCDVILPQQPDPNAPARTYPVVYLLHSITKGHSAWQRLTSIERYARRYGVIVVMPEAHLSSYADMKHGGKFFTYIADELPRAMRNFFPISDRREDTFICGASMGGYGALKIALNRPDRYAAAGSLSAGCISYRGYIEKENARGLTLKWLTFEENGLDEEDADTAARVRALAKTGDAPAIFLSCGAEDALLIRNCRETRDLFEEAGKDAFRFEYAEHPGGHDWDYWDAHICDFFRFAGLKDGQRLL